MDLYKFAAANRIRFASSRGDLTVEQLFDLPLKSTKNDFDLDTVARNIYEQVQRTGEVSFVESATPDPETEVLEIALEIVKDVIATKQADNAAERQSREKAAMKAKLLDILAAKKDQALMNATPEEIEAQLAALS